METDKNREMAIETAKNLTIALRLTLHGVSTGCADTCSVALQAIEKASKVLSQFASKEEKQ